GLWPIYWLAWGLFNWLLMPVVERLVNFVLSARLQGADRVGTLLAYISPEPRFHENERGPVPEVLELGLLEYAEAHLAGATGEGYRWVMEQLLAASKASGDRGELARRMLRGLDVSRGLIHNSYMELPELRSMIAQHILAWSGVGPGGLADYSRAGTAMPSPAATPRQEWLDRLPGNEQGAYPPATVDDIPGTAGHRTPAAPLDGTPLWPRALLA